MKLDRVIKEGSLEERVFKLRPAGQEEEPRDRKEWVKMRAREARAKVEKLTLLKRPRCWERLKAGGEGDDRG